VLARIRSSWTAVVPVVGLIALAVTWGVSPGPVLATVIAVVLVGAVLAAVHHAEVVAHRVGEPFGSLVLAVAVTIIEVALIVTLIASGARRHGPGLSFRRCSWASRRWPRLPCTACSC
jgi:Ca2+:H+ antiporter